MRMTVSTPVGGTECSADQARTAYAPGVDEASACVFTFPTSSVDNVQLGPGNGAAVMVAFDNAKYGVFGIAMVHAIVLSIAITATME